MAFTNMSHLRYNIFYTSDNKHEGSVNMQNYCFEKKIKRAIAGLLFLLFVFGAVLINLPTAWAQEPSSCRADGRAERRAGTRSFCCSKQRGFPFRKPRARAFFLGRRAAARAFPFGGRAAARAFRFGGRAGTIPFAF